MKLLTIKEVGETLKLSRWSVCGMIETGALPALLLKSGRKKKTWRIREEALQKWIAEREQETKRMVQQRNRPAVLSVVNGEQAS